MEGDADGDGDGEGTGLGEDASRAIGSMGDDAGRMIRLRSVGAATRKRVSCVDFGGGGDTEGECSFSAGCAGVSFLCTST